MHMTGEAKRAARMEKKLKVLTGGYQVYCLLFLLIKKCVTRREIDINLYNNFITDQGTSINETITRSMGTNRTSAFRTFDVQIFAITRRSGCAEASKRAYGRC